jgi:hypothetical protein
MPPVQRATGAARAVSQAAQVMPLTDEFLAAD